LAKKYAQTQKPESLLHRVLLASSNKDDMILDPFLGSGTTATVAKKLGRNYFGIEKEKSYFKAAEQRLKNTKPIEDVFEGANLDVYKHIPSDKVKLDLSAIKESFCYLFVGHWMAGDMGHDRKNVGLMVDYFFQTFKNKNQRPALILKASTGRNSYMSREEMLNKIGKIKKQYPNDDLPNVYVLKGALTDKQVNELYNHKKVNAMVSFTKGEGFGRPLQEFCLSKKPLIVSGWSGHMDFILPEYNLLIGGQLKNIHESAVNQFLLKEAQWFNIDTEVASKAMKNVYKN
jgi:hypothetical protein